MATLIGRFLNATKNSDGSVTLEFGLGTPTTSMGLTFMILSAAEVSALSTVLGGSAGTKSQAKHDKEVSPQGYEN